MVKRLPKPLNRVFFALSDPTRRAILARLSDRELTITALAEPFAISFVAVSKHIRVLEDAGLLKAQQARARISLAFSARTAAGRGGLVESVRSILDRPPGRH